MKKMIKVLCIVLCAALLMGIGAMVTLALLQDSDEAYNVMTLGNVYIDQNELERDANGDLVAFTQGKPLYPAWYQNGSIPWADAAEWPVAGDEAWKVVEDNENVIDKFVTVTNTGKSAAYVRTIIAVEVGEGGACDPYIHLVINEAPAWNFAWVDGGAIVEIDGNYYCIGVFTHTTAVAPGETTVPSLKQVYLDVAAKNEDVEALGDTYEILVVSQAVQTKGFATAEEALTAGFGTITTTTHPWTTGVNVPALVNTAEELAAALNSGKNVILNADIEDAPVATTAPYGNKLGIAQNGGTLDGNGKELMFDSHSGDHYGIMTSGGTIKNVTIGGAFRGIVVMNAQEDVIIDNVIIDDEYVCYALNTAEGNGTKNVIVSNSTLKGWTSIGNTVKSVSFTNCTFGQGTYYTNVYGRLVKPYVNAVFENCEFESLFYVDLSSLAAGQTVTLRNCTVNGVKLTAENWTTLVAPENTCGAGQISIELRDGTYMTAGNVADYVIFE